MKFPKFRCKLYKFYIPRCGTRYSTSALTEKSNKTYKSTVFLPATAFPSFPKNVVKNDEMIQEKAKFLDYYEWQRKHVSGTEFVLHDGPPYANGVPHMGHAINKIFKDIILRSKLIQGLKVHFVPGWDCHGLPIELVALKESNTKLSPRAVREQSEMLAMNKLNEQREAFKKWGILGNWDKPYFTCSSEYVINEMKIFWNMYEKGYMYYGLKPVYWSPSSCTALAESELEYVDDHVSPAVTVRFEIVNKPNSEPMYILIWTTTPWTLPVNQGVYFSKELEYALVRIESLNGTYIIASNLLEENRRKLNKEITVLRPVSHNELMNFKYKHPWWRDRIMSVFEAPEVQEVATGFLHTAPGHGHLDFVMGLENGLSVECFVDEEGCFTKDLGPDMTGLNVLDAGSARIIEKLEADIVFKEQYVHRYPYDWRTNKPVIIRASNQWFIDTDKLRDRALESLSTVSVPHNYFEVSIKNRPYWCLSRQRVWGVPIPVFINKTNGKPLISRGLIDHLCQVIEKSGTGAWWSLDKKDLLPQRLCDEFNVNIEDVEKGKDIMDIWFDSGISWSFVLDGKTADLCVEGVDQFGGWFQSLLLTSVAVQGKAPYKKLLVHGFAVDEEGRKMSKSKGNVFDPNFVMQGNRALGVNTLRWWVAAHGHKTKAPVSYRLLEMDNREITKMRQIMKFLLGSIMDYKGDTLKSLKPLPHLDSYCLNSSYNLYQEVINGYNAYNFQDVTSKLNNFVASVVSSLYIFSVKDRLYCDGLDSKRRKSCLYTLSGILDTLCHCIAPILPHLAEEVYSYHPMYSGKPLFYNDKMWSPPSSWKNESSTEVINLAKEIKGEILEIEPHPSKFSCIVQLGENDYSLLKTLQGDNEVSYDSELTELLQVADVTLKIGERRITLEKVGNSQCPRCRRYTASNTQLCRRCEDVVSELVSHK